MLLFQAAEYSAATVGKVPAPMARRAPSDQAARPSYEIARVERGVRRAIAARVEPHGLTVPQYTAMSILLRRSGLSNSQLARRSYVTPQSMNAVIASLEERRLIRRVQSRDHARVLRTELTATGRRLLARCDAEIEAFEQQMLAVLSPRERSAFTEALAVIARQIEALEHDGQRSPEA